MSWYLQVLRKYAVFSGRARRKEYWMFYLFTLLFLVPLIVVDMMTGTLNRDIGFGVLSGLYVLATLLPTLAVSVRRLHDIGRSGWWLLIGLIPILGPMVLFITTVLDSEPGVNHYGPNPKTAPTVEPPPATGEVGA